MSYTVWIENARRRDLAVLSARPSAGSRGEAIDTRVTRLYELLRTAPVTTIGRNVAVYRASAGSPNAQHWLRAVPIEVGVECVLPPRGVDAIEVSATPEGLVATTEHLGPLETLPDAHGAVRAWCMDGRSPVRAGRCTADVRGFAPKALNPQTTAYGSVFLLLHCPGTHWRPEAGNQRIPARGAGTVPPRRVSNRSSKIESINQSVSKAVTDAVGDEP